MSAAAPSVRPAFERRIRRADRILGWLFAGIAALTVLLLLGMFTFLILNGIGTFREVSLSHFFFGSSWNPTSIVKQEWGILPLLLGTCLVAFGSLVVAVPFGLALALYLSQLASRHVREVLKPVIEMIAGIPSVVLGLIGLLYVAPLVARMFHLSNGLTALTAGILVGIATVPTIASLCEDALASVSFRLTEASLALGATRSRTIRRVLIPAASSGIIAAVMLGLGRAIGETMIVLMVAGNSLAFPNSFLDPVRPMTATIAIEIREVVFGDLHWQSLFAVGLALFLLTFVINAVTDYFFLRSRT